MNDQSQMMNRAFGMWPPQDPMAYQTPIPVFSAGVGPIAGRMSWKSKKAADNRNKYAAAAYRPPKLKELQSQNRLKARRFYPKKKIAHFAPFAPHNTTSFIIRAKKSGGITSLVSPCPVTPAILPTPRLSPTREGLVDMAKEEWGVDGYGSMKGLIWLRSPTRIEMPATGWGEEVEEEEEAEPEPDDGSSDSDLEEHLEVERRLDHDLSRFEMVYPGDEDAPPPPAVGDGVNRVDSQDSRIARLEEENLTLKERIFLIGREMGDMQRRLQKLEMQFQANKENNNNIINNNNDNDINMEGMNESSNASEEASETNKGGDLCSAKSTGESNGNLMLEINEGPMHSVGTQVPSMESHETPVHGGIWFTVLSWKCRNSFYAPN